MVNKNILGITVLCVMLLVIASFLIGMSYKETKLSKDFTESINICEDGGQILRMYIAGENDIRPECFGEKPALEVHFG